MKPRFKHDCDRCRFVGHLSIQDTGGTGDVYVCPSERIEPTILVRYSDDPPDYSSMALFDSARRMFEQYPESTLAQAYAMARRKKLI